MSRRGQIVARLTYRFPALKGWANIGRRFATTGSWPVTTFVTENILQGQEDQVSKEKGGQDSFIENGTDS